MAKRRRSNRSMKMQPAITDLYFKADLSTATGAGDSRVFIDTAKELSKCNRRLYEQGRMYAYQGLTFIWKPDTAGNVATIDVTVTTAGNSWIVHNAFVKAKALWNEMQDLVLDDNPSIAGKWRDFKVELHSGQTTARMLSSRDGNGVLVQDGEWERSTFVMPQHVVDPVTGVPLPAEEKHVVLIGADTGRVSLVNAYQESRVTVQPVDPNVPAGMSTSFFNLLTDSGSQEPELADIIEDEGDAPPYQVDNYPEVQLMQPGDSRFNTVLFQQRKLMGVSAVSSHLVVFFEIEIKGYTALGAEVSFDDMPEIDLLLHVAPGMYKGVAAIPMGQ